MINSFTMEDCYFYEPKVDYNGFKGAAKDVRNFARHIKVTHPSLGVIPFKARDYQNGLLKRYQKSDWDVVKHTRQSGVTTMNCIYALWFTLFHPHKTIVITSPNMQNTAMMNELIREMYDGLNLMKPAALSVNRNRISFETGSTIIFKSMEPVSFRGMTIDLLICDNYGYVEDRKAREFITSMGPCLHSSGAKIILSSSSSNNKNTSFEEIFKDAGKNGSKFKAFNIRGHQVPTRNTEWEASLIEKMGWAKFKEEFNY